MVVLRSMMQAVYQPANAGHFGLALEAYAHFTSPIRRYADLLVHRGIRHIIRSRQKSSMVTRVSGATIMRRDTIYPYGEAELAEIGVHISATDRRAEMASRDMLDWLKCEYMEQHLGSEFDGTVTGVTNFGLFLELDELYVQGLLHVSSLPADYYHFDEAALALAGESGGGRFGLGDRLRVQVARVSMDERKIDFSLIDVITSSAAPPRGRRKRGERKSDGRQKSSGKGGKGGGKDTKAKGKDKDKDKEKAGKGGKSGSGRSRSGRRRR